MSADTERLAQIEARLDAATPGPWYVEAAGDFGAKTANIPDVLRERYGNNALQCGEDFATAALITNAPADLRWLLDRLREAESQLARVNRALDDELANLADDGARLSHSVVRRFEAALRGDS